MRVDLLTFAALLLNTQWVAGNPQVVNPKFLDPTNPTIAYAESSSASYGNNAWESDSRYASASPYMNIDGDPSMSASYGTVTVYANGIAHKETSSPGVFYDSTDDTAELGNETEDGDHTETVYITVGNGNQSGSESIAEPDGPVTVTVGGSDNGTVTVTAGASEDGPKTVTVGGSEDGPVTVTAGASDDGPVTVTVGASDDDKPEVVTPIIQVNMEVINGQTVPVTSTISGSNPTPSDSGPQIITVTAEPTEKDINQLGPTTVTVNGASPTEPAQVIVQNDGPQTVTVISTNLHTDYVTVTDGVGGSQGAGGDTNIVVVGGQNGGGGVVDGANGIVSLAPNTQPLQPPVPSKTTYLKTIMTASMDIVRVIGPTYTNTIAINGNYVGPQQPTQGPQMSNPYIQTTPTGVPLPNGYFGQNNGNGGNFQYYGQNNAFFGQNNGGSFPGQNNNFIPGQQNSLSQPGGTFGGAVNTNVPIIQ
ncbi:hypothetical protein H4R20_000708 [Coemansia guatemalensis]|uniref:Uncharacterized protein n=1 Tax=Coemansia guatemalensis TaxID=2761395 RepID=A0A9W8HYP2_9FUNG|nr:hypothetical protein H4R20_000708 [Coemansia guatemalensis]